MKYSTHIGIGAAILLVVACFLPWAYYPDLDKVFTGFFSEKNQYGRPGIAVVFFAVAGVVLFLIPKIWAKRFNQFVAALLLAYVIKSYFLFTSCYLGICPEKRVGLYLLIVASMAFLLAAILPDLKIERKP